MNVEEVMERVEKVSKSYLPEPTDEKYATTLRKSNLKIKHTRAVIAICDEVANVCNISKENKEILLMAAAVHDIPGRDKQYKDYGTWIDKRCPKDHGTVGYELLIENNYSLLKQVLGIDLPESTCKIIADVVYWHCKEKIEVEDEVTKELLDCLITADGIDLFRHRIEDDWEDMFTDTVPNEQQVAKSTFSPRLYEEFLKVKPGEILDFKYREAPLSEHYVDAILLNYAIANKSTLIAKQTIVNMGYIDKLYNRFINVEFSQETKQQMNKVYEQTKYLIDCALKDNVSN